MRGTQCGADRFRNYCGNYLGSIVCESTGIGHDCGHCGPSIGPCVMTPEEGGEGSGFAPSLSAEIREPADSQERLIWQRLRAISQAGVPERFATLWTELASLRSLHMRMQVESWRPSSATSGNHEMWGAGSFETWEQGGRFRYSAQVPPAVNLVQWTDIGFDGDRLASYDAQDGILSVRRSAMRSWPIAYRHPIALALFILNPFDEAACGGCELRLSDLRSSLPTALPRRGAAGAPFVVQAPPARFGVQVVSGYRMRELAEIDDRGGHPQVIERVAKGGVVLERVELRNFNPVAGQPTLQLPWKLTYEIFDEYGHGPMLRTVYKIEHIEANREIAAETFHLSIPGARIWDEEARAFVP